MEITPSLHRIGNDIVAAYLVVTDEGITIIDAGMAGHWADLQAELATLGRPLSDIRGLVLTHGDSDHIGFAERLRRDHGVPVYVHEADAARARGETKTSPSFGPMKIGATAGFFWYSMRKGGLRTTHLTEVTAVRDGQVLDLPGAPRIIGLPGHSPGSIAIHVPVADAIFMGDAMTTRHVLTGKRGPQLMPRAFAADGLQSLASLKALERLDAPLTLFGHGEPWTEGLSKAVEHARERGLT